jgi:hypothetical protein
MILIFQTGRYENCQIGVLKTKRHGGKTAEQKLIESRQM